MQMMNYMSLRQLPTDIKPQNNATATTMETSGWLLFAKQPASQHGDQEGQGICYGDCYG